MIPLNILRRLETSYEIEPIDGTFDKNSYDINRYNLSKSWLESYEKRYEILRHSA